ncbi:hypothetical protein NDU88_007380 [Pleurodeles waltl]|uniref:Uncharacterized protein n=1 Tax=Pleurodeles waltl TaxID=8319 RepID=A0AAV7MMT0_PLEWA|nr:hypothetical protein NDU88_007380 [Pleurodeles waltl]
MSIKRHPAGNGVVRSSLPPDKKTLHFWSVIQVFILEKEGGLLTSNLHYIDYRSVIQVFTIEKKGGLLTGNLHYTNYWSVILVFALTVKKEAELRTGKLHYTDYRLWQQGVCDAQSGSGAQVFEMRSQTLVRDVCDAHSDTGAGVLVMHTQTLVPRYLRCAVRLCRTGV